MGKRRFGWLREHPDLRDYTPYREVVSRLLLRTSWGKNEKPPLKADLRDFCSPVKDQGELGSCTANAASALVECSTKRAFGKSLPGSRLFLYKNTRKLLHWKGDSGGYMRTTVGALSLFGLPPEEYWPYEIGAFDEEPPAFLYAMGQSFQSLVYYRVDREETPDAVLLQIKKHLASGLPLVFGFSVYSSFSKAEESGRVPFPSSRDRLEGGHAVMAAGYDDKMAISREEGGKSQGAFLFQNSWGGEWGEAGFGWLPYDYLLRGLTGDWWSVVKSEWLDTEALL